MSKHSVIRNQILDSVKNIKLLNSASLIITAPIPKNELILHSPYNYRVLMAKRVTKGSFGGAHVFPGGRLDSSDSSPQWSVCIDSNTDGGDTDGLDKFKICAIRETFEETGFLAANKPLDRSELGSTEVHDNTELLDLCVSKNVKLLTSRVKHFSRWITPEIAPKRFDTHFFMLNIDDSSQYDTPLLDQITISPSSENAMYVQDRELMYMEWKTPQEYIDAYCKKQIALISPQLYVLMQMLQFHDHKDLAEFASYRAHNDMINPFISYGNHNLTERYGLITFPGDYMYEKPIPSSEITDLLDNNLDLNAPMDRLYITENSDGYLDIEMIENLYTVPTVIKHIRIFSRPNT